MATQTDSAAGPSSPRQPAASSNVALATRLALLELLTLGTVPTPAAALSLTHSPATSAAGTSPNTSLVARSQEAHTRLHDGIQRYKPIVQFVEQYRANQAYLLPQLGAATASAQHIGSSVDATPSSLAQQSVAPQSVIALLFDAEAEVRQLERDLRACDTYAKRDVAGAGHLAQHERLRPRLTAIKAQLAQTLAREQANERDALALMQRYQTHVDTLSQLFIHWDTMLTTVEDSLGRLERQKA